MKNLLVKKTARSAGAVALHDEARHACCDAVILECSGTPSRLLADWVPSFDRAVGRLRFIISRDAYVSLGTTP